MLSTPSGPSRWGNLLRTASVKAPMVSRTIDDHAGRQWFMSLHGSCVNAMSARDVSKIQWIAISKDAWIFCFFVLFDILGFLSLFRWKNGKGTQKLYDEYETEFPVITKTANSCKLVSLSALRMGTALCVWNIDSILTKVNVIVIYFIMELDTNLTSSC